MQKTKVKCPGTVVEVGGNSFVLPPISIGSIERHADAFNAIAEGNLPHNQLGVLGEIIFESLLRNYADVDRDTIVQSVDVANMAALMVALMQSDPAKLTRELEADNAAMPA